MRDRRTRQRPGTVMFWVLAAVSGQIDEQRFFCVYVCVWGGVCIARGV